MNQKTQQNKRTPTASNKPSPLKDTPASTRPRHLPVHWVAAQATPPTLCQKPFCRRSRDVHKICCANPRPIAWHSNSRLLARPCLRILVVKNKLKICLSLTVFFSLRYTSASSSRYRPRASSASVITAVCLSIFSAKLFAWLSSLFFWSLTESDWSFAACVFQGGIQSLFYRLFCCRLGRELF